MITEHQWCRSRAGQVHLQNASGSVHEPWARAPSSSICVCSGGLLLLVIGMPQRASLNVIYDTFLNGHLSRGFADEVLAFKDSVIKGAMNLHGEVMQKFRKTAANFIMSSTSGP